jgi:hypothetical protein
VTHLSSTSQLLCCRPSLPPPHDPPPHPHPSHTPHHRPSPLLPSTPSPSPLPSRRPPPLPHRRQHLLPPLLRSSRRQPPCAPASTHTCRRSHLLPLPSPPLLPLFAADAPTSSLSRLPLSLAPPCCSSPTTSAHPSLIVGSNGEERCGGSDGGRPTKSTSAPVRWTQDPEKKRLRQCNFGRSGEVMALMA